MIVAAVALFASRATRKGDVARPSPLPVVAKTNPSSAYKPVRVVLSIPVREDHWLLARSPKTAGPAAAPRKDDHAPAATYRKLGKTFRSAPAAKAFLNDLTPSEQLIAARIWAADGTHPAVTFARLRELSVRPDLARDVREVLAELATDARLRPWLRGYRLIGLAPIPESMPSNPS